MRRRRHGVRQQEAGFVLLLVLVILLIVGGSSASFIWFMNQQQARVGARMRTTAAVAVAEAGVHRALAVLETVTPDGRSPGRTWRPTAHSEVLRVGTLEGRYTLSLQDDSGGAILITSVGQVAGVTRRLRARVYLTTPALLSALYGTSYVRLENPPAATVILPYGAGIADRPWIHIAAGQGIWFATSEVSINEPAVTFDVGTGPLDIPHPRTKGTPLPRPGPVRLLLARGAELRLGREHQPVDVQQLRVMGVYVEGVVLRSEALLALPEVRRDFYRARAAENTANASLNKAVGEYLGDADLARKRDSMYSPAQFEQLQGYWAPGLVPPRLVGVIYITGGLALLEGQRLQIVDGALVTESTVHLSRGASLEITHTVGTRTLPGLIVLDNGALVVMQQARLRVHGLVYASRVFDVGDGAHVDIVGSVLGNDPGLSFRNSAATVVIRYDPAVLGTPGLNVPDEDPVVAWIAAWEELERMSPPRPTVPLSPPLAASQTERFAPPPLPPPPPSTPATVAAPSSPPETQPIPKVTVTRRRPVEATPPRGRVQEGPRHRVQVGAYAIRKNADARAAVLRDAGFRPYIVKKGQLVKVLVGAFRDRAAARKLAARLRARGYHAIIVP